MKHVSIVLLIAMVNMASSAINQAEEIAEESKPSSFQPKPLDDDWSKWLVGEWEGSRCDGVSGIGVLTTTELQHDTAHGRGMAGAAPRQMAKRLLSGVVRG